jgi:hypothetical protein
MNEPNIFQQLAEIKQDISSINSVKSYFAVVLDRISSIQLSTSLIILNIIVMFVFLMYIHVFFKNSDEMLTYFVSCMGLFALITSLNIKENNKKIMSYFLILMVGMIMLNYYRGLSEFNTLHIFKTLMLLLAIPIIFYMSLNIVFIFDDIFNLIYWTYKKVFEPVIDSFANIKNGVNSGVKIAEDISNDVKSIPKAFDNLINDIKHIL